MFEDCDAHELKRSIEGDLSFKSEESLKKNIYKRHFKEEKRKSVELEDKKEDKQVLSEPISPQPLTLSPDKHDVVIVKDAG